MKTNAFLLVFPFHAQDSPRLWNSPRKDGMRGERSQARKDRGKELKEALERERWREMGGGRSLCSSAPFGSFIPQRLGFIGGSFNNKGLCVLKRSRAAFAWASLPFFILRW